MPARPDFLRPYLLYSAAQLASIRAGLESAVAQWSARWLHDAPPAWQIAWLDDAHSSRAQALLEQQHGGLLVGLDDSAGQAVMRGHIPAAAAQRAYVQACGELGPSAKIQTPLTLSTGRAIVDDLFLALLGPAARYIKSQAPALDGMPCIKGSASVLVVLDNGGQETACLLSAAVAQVWLASATAGAKPATARRALTARKAAIGKSRLALRVEAGDCEMTLSDLLALAPGNIVRLNLTVHDAFQVVTASTRLPVCKASLGQQAGHKAVQLVAG
ncbi:MAG: FliM/FliN family flagellar motor switch protein [Burkholderiaceae bacterium]|nr:FliM/FliN family flagellar motor switch protein [Burkholderiaceae bacterium]